MLNKNKIFFIVFFLILAGSVAFAWHKIMVQADYVVQNQIDCDPETEDCFIWECDPETDAEGEACTGDPEEDVWYYKLARRNAQNIPDCDPEEDEDSSAEEECDPWTCDLGEPDCQEILCDEKTATEEEAECSNPEEYLLNNPPEEEGSDEEEADCAEDDEECSTDEEDSSGSEDGEGETEESEDDKAGVSTDVGTPVGTPENTEEESVLE